jgi:hypothetical protein
MDSARLAPTAALDQVAYPILGQLGRSSISMVVRSPAMGHWRQNSNTLGLAGKGAGEVDGNAGHPVGHGAGRDHASNKGLEATSRSVRRKDTGPGSHANPTQCWNCLLYGHFQRACPSPKTRPKPFLQGEDVVGGATTRRPIENYYVVPQAKHDLITEDNDEPMTSGEENPPAKRPAGKSPTPKTVETPEDRGRSNHLDVQASLTRSEIGNKFPKGIQERTNHQPYIRGLQHGLYRLGVLLLLALIALEIWTVPLASATDPTVKMHLYPNQTTSQEGVHYPCMDFYASSVSIPTPSQLYTKEQVYQVMENHDYKVRCEAQRKARAATMKAATQKGKDAKKHSAFWQALLQFADFCVATLMACTFLYCTIQGMIWFTHICVEVAIRLQPLTGIQCQNW